MTDHTDASDRASGADGATSEPASAASSEQAPNRMGDVDHTHPHRNTTFGSIFGRGPSVAADGGVPAAADQDDATMAEVSHESPTGTDPNAAFERGSESIDSQAPTGVSHGGVASDE